MEKKSDTFKYSYSSRMQEELQDIKQKYTEGPQHPKEDDMERLRKLDRRPARKASVISINLGIAGCLIMGFGMCCTMVWAGDMFIAGIIIGVAGMIILSLAYPVFKRVLKNERNKIAPQVLDLVAKLSDKG